MTDKDLFMKYNMVPTYGMKKNEALTKRLQNGDIKFEEPKINKQILLLLHANYTCNLSCIYCEHQHLRKDYRNAVMSEDMVREIVYKLGPILRNVTWHGGEPLLLPDAMFEALEQEKQKFGYHFETMLQTNAVNLTPDKLAMLDRLGIMIGTSFDGLNNSVSRGEKSTEAILRLLKECPDRVSFIAVNYVDTAHQLIENYEYFKSLGCRHIQNCIVRENVMEDGSPYLIPNDIAVPAVLQYINYWMHDTNAPVHDSYIVRQIQRVLGYTHLCEDAFCVGGWIIIDPLGNIGLCGHNQQDSGIVNIHDIRSYHDLIMNPKYMSILNKQYKLVKTCADCEWYRVCYGACMGTNYEYDHSYRTINPKNCEFIKRTLSGVYDLIKDVDVTQTDRYNPLFLDVLRECNYYSLSEIKKIEGVCYG